MSNFWTLLNSNFPNKIAIYTSLKAVLSSLEEGEISFPKKEITVPAIQPLKSLFSSTDQCTDQCIAPVRQDQKDVMELIEKTSKMDALHIIVSNTSQMAANAWRRLYKLHYNVNLLEFFTQDFICIYLQLIDSKRCDDPLERQGRCSSLIDHIVNQM